MEGAEELVTLEELVSACVGLCWELRMMGKGQNNSGTCRKRVQRRRKLEFGMYLPC